MAILQGAGSKEPQLVSTQLTLASTYLASFSLAQHALKVSDSSLETADGDRKLSLVLYSDTLLDTMG